MPEASTAAGVRHSDEDPLLQGGPQGLNNSPSQESTGGRSASALWRRIWSYTAAGQLPSRSESAEIGQPSNSGSTATSLGSSVQPEVEESTTREGVDDGICTTSAVAGEISPSTSANGPEDHNSISSRPSRNMEPASQDASEGQIKRTSSSSPRSQDGGGLLDRFLGNIAGSLSLKRSSSNAAVGQGTCLICLESVEPEDFESGEALLLDCACRGEMAVRHRVCAEKWSSVKGDRICDVCKKEIKNLPELPPRATDGDGDTTIDINMFDDADHPGHPHGLGGPFMGEVPGSADVVFDLIRVTWVAMIICILFLEMSLPMSLWTGLIVGIAYTIFVKLMYRSQLAALQREQAREREQANLEDTIQVSGIRYVPALPRMVTIV